MNSLCTPCCPPTSDSLAPVSVLRSLVCYRAWPPSLFTAASLVPQPWIRTSHVRGCPDRLGCPEDGFVMSGSVGTEGRPQTLEIKGQGRRQIPRQAAPSGPAASCLPASSSTGATCSCQQGRFCAGAAAWPGPVSGGCAALWGAYQTPETAA